MRVVHVGSGNQVVSHFIGVWNRDSDVVEDVHGNYRSSMYEGVVLALGGRMVEEEGRKNSGS